jgi:hypothetical protein
VNFFLTTYLPSFNKTQKLANLVVKVVGRKACRTCPAASLITIHTENIARWCWLVLRNNVFVEQLATNSTYFKDPPA